MTMSFRSVIHNWWCIISVIVKWNTTESNIKVLYVPVYAMGCVHGYLLTSFLF